MNSGMTRSTFRNIWILLNLVLLGLAFMAFQWGGQEQETIALHTAQLRTLKSELEHAERRSVALEELNKLTINEKTATRLDILRHLGLEQSDYDFQVNARLVKQISGVNLYLRIIRLQGSISHDQAMALLDRLHETRKIVISKVELKRSTKPGDMVDLVMEGTIYGLEKTDGK